MEVNCYFKKAYEPETGVSKGTGSTWVKQTFLVETGGQFNSDIAFDVWNNKCDLSQFKEMDRVCVKFNATSHEFTDKNGKVRYMHNLIAYSVSKAETQQVFQKQQPPVEQTMQPVNPTPTDDNLPF